MDFSTIFYLYKIMINVVFRSAFKISGVTFLHFAGNLQLKDYMVPASIYLWRTFLYSSGHTISKHSRILKWLFARSGSEGR